MAAQTPELIETTLSDRELLLHLLMHAEAQTEQIGRLLELVDVLEEFRPLLNLVRGPNGKPDYVGLAQVRRNLRRLGGS